MKNSEVTVDNATTLNIAHKNLNENKILTTKLYDDFKSIIGNRNININHLNKLKESLKEKDLKIPIIVNEKLEVIDGQHRLQARRELNLPVYYIIISGLGITDTQKANANNKNWNSNDFLKFYVSQNYYHYKIFQTFQNKWKFNIWECLALLGFNDFSSREFYNGEFVSGNIDVANDMADKIYQIEPFYKGFKRRGFVLAMIKLLKNKEFDFEDFIQKLSYQSSKMVDCTTTAQYLKIIEEIYNYKRRNEEKIRFQ